MQHHNDYRELLKIIRMQPVVCSWGEEVRYRDTSFRQYSGTKRDIALLCGPVARKTSDRDTVRRLITKLENSDIACSNHLAGYSQNLINLFSTYTRQEPYTASYYDSLIISLQSLYELADIFQQKVQQYLLHELKKRFYVDALSGNTLYVDSRDMEDVSTVMESYMNDMLEQYDYFSRLAHQESGNDKKAIITTTQAEQYLLHLVSLIEKLIRHTETTILQLEEWQVQLSALEMQEINN